MLVDYSGYNLKHIGISCGGLLDTRKGVIYSPPNLPGWDNVPVTRIFREEFGVETALQNDANEIVGISAEYLGQGLAILIDVLNPECIVIGSIYARNEILFKPLIEKVTHNKNYHEE